jgi:hypothetical protein
MTMRHDGRRLLYRADYLRAAIDRASTVVASEYRDELQQLRRELDELREVALLLVRLRREEAEMTVDALQKELERVLVKLAMQHRNGMPLH